MPSPNFSLQIVRQQFYMECHFFSLMTMPLAMFFFKLMLFIYKCFVSILKGWKTSGFLLSFLAYWWFAFCYAWQGT